jgi:secreted trypsin-like serine protease
MLNRLEQIFPIYIYIYISRDAINVCACVCVCVCELLVFLFLTPIDEQRSYETKSMILNLSLILVVIELLSTIVATTQYTCQSNASCGCSINDAVLTKIIGGEPANIDTWSWAVSVRVDNNHICGGSLISSTLVITAAHCLLVVRTKSSLAVTIGSKYLFIVHQRRTISDVYLHRYYDAKRYIHDIALLRLSSPVSIIDGSLAIICLPTNLNRYYPSANRTVVAIGWGVLSTDDKRISPLLQQVTLKTIASTSPSCQRTIYDSRVQFCAGVHEGSKGNQ